MSLLETFQARPLNHDYPLPTQAFFESIKTHNQPIEIFKSKRITLDATYSKIGIDGASERTFLRKFVLDQIHVALTNLPEHFGFLIYDGYRSPRTQRGLRNSFLTLLRDRHPDWSEDAIVEEARKFVSNPDDPTRTTPPPHSTGGAVDICLTLDGFPVDMGTPFDDLSNRASTNYFESGQKKTLDSGEQEILVNRRVLYHSLRQVGFTNWKHEWWHYEIGTGGWANTFQAPYSYPPMDISGLLRS